MSVAMKPIGEGETMRRWFELMGRNNLPAAETLLRSSLKANPDSQTLILHLSGTCASRGNVNEALHFARLSIEKDPANPDAHNHMAGLCLQNSDLQAGEQAARAALDLRQDHEGALLHLGLATLAQGKYHEAHHWLDTLLAQNPLQATAMFTRASVHLAMREYDHAKTALEAAVAMAPNEAGFKQRLDYVMSL